VFGLENTHFIHIVIVCFRKVEFFCEITGKTRGCVDKHAKRNKEGIGIYRHSRWMDWDRRIKMREWQTNGHREM
jgi:hypothetical protein